MRVSGRGPGTAVAALSHGKGARVSIGRGTPTKREGSDGDLTLRSTNRGVILYAKYGGHWYSIHTSQPLVKGMIIMWSGSRSSIPSGWLLCDGSNTTPDLRAKFIIGAGPGNVDDFDEGSEAPTYSGTIFGPDNSWGGSVRTNGKACGDGTDDATAVSMGDGPNHMMVANNIAAHDHHMTNHEVSYLMFRSGSGYDPAAFPSGVTINGVTDHETRTGNFGGEYPLSHDHDDATGKLTPGTTELPAVDFYSLAFIMYVGSASDPGTEGYTQSGEGGGELGREGP